MHASGVHVDPMLSVGRWALWMRRWKGCRTRLRSARDRNTGGTRPVSYGSMIEAEKDSHRELRLENWAAGSWAVRSNTGQNMTSNIVTNRHT
eukprot:7992780-Pyramimonas_sp.AAC.2